MKAKILDYNVLEPKSSGVLKSNRIRIEYPDGREFDILVEPAGMLVTCIDAGRYTTNPGIKIVPRVSNQIFIDVLEPGNPPRRRGSRKR